MNCCGVSESWACLSGLVGAAGICRDACGRSPGANLLVGKLSRLQLPAMSAMVESGSGLMVCIASEWTATFCQNLCGCRRPRTACPRPSKLHMVLSGVHSPAAPLRAGLCCADSCWEQDEHAPCDCERARRLPRHTVLLAADIGLACTRLLCESFWLVW